MSIDFILMAIKIIIKFSCKQKYPSSGKSHFPYYLTWAPDQNIVFLSSQVTNFIPFYETQEGAEFTGRTRDVKIT